MILKKWLLSIVVISLFGTVLVALSEKYTQSSVIKTCVSLAIVLTMIHPIRNLTSFSFPVFSYSESAKQYIGSAQNASRNLICQELESYLESYAQKTLSIDCNAEVQLNSDLTECAIPESVVITYQESSEIFEKHMSEKIFVEFGINADNLEFIRGI